VSLSMSCAMLLLFLAYIIFHVYILYCADAPTENDNILKTVAKAWRFHSLPLCSCYLVRVCVCVFVSVCVCVLCNANRASSKATRLFLVK